MKCSDTFSTMQAEQDSLHTIYTPYSVVLWVFSSMHVHLSGHCETLLNVMKCSDTFSTMQAEQDSLHTIYTPYSVVLWVFSSMHVHLSGHCETLLSHSKK
jgi:hypothetical protein